MTSYRGGSQRCPGNLKPNSHRPERFFHDMSADNRPDTFKKKKELALLRTAYDLERYDYQESERPDFILKHKGATEGNFGVEITELFVNESDARLTNIQGYFDDIITGKANRKGSPYRHADDVAGLPVESVTVTDKDGNVKYESLRVIFREFTPEDQHGRRLAARIAEKNRLVADYLNRVDRVDLVVYDWMEAGPPIGESHAVNDLLVGELREALNDSRFGEVYLVSTTLDGDEVYRPLRLLCLLEAAYIFTHSFEETPELVENMELEQATAVFAHAARARDLNVGYASDGEALVLYGGVGMQFVESGVQFIEFDGVNPNTSAELPIPAIDEERLSAIIDHYVSVSKRGLFQSGLVYPAHIPIGVSMGWKSQSAED